jgi:hypothetical protein
MVAMRPRDGASRALPDPAATITALPTPIIRATSRVTHTFGQPSNYSLAAQELAAHIRLLRRQGWQSWRIRARFDYGEAA